MSEDVEKEKSEKNDSENSEADRIALKESQDMFVLFSQNHPELFSISPRPGGFLRLLVPSRSQDFMAIPDNLRSTSSATHAVSAPATCAYQSKTRLSDFNKIRIFSTRPSSPSRDFRNGRRMNESDVSSAHSSTSSCCNYLCNQNVTKESMDLLAVTISCVMQMAAKLDVPQKSLLWAEGYLQCMKDQKGRYPRNIVGILSHIKQKLEKKDNKLSTQLEEDENEVLFERCSRCSIGSSVLSQEQRSTGRAHVSAPPSIPESDTPYETETEST